MTRKTRKKTNTKRDDNNEEDIQTTSLPKWYGQNKNTISLSTLANFSLAYRPFLQEWKPIRLHPRGRGCGIAENFPCGPLNFFTLTQKFESRIDPVTLTLRPLTTLDQQSSPLLPPPHAIQEGLINNKLVIIRRQDF